LYIKTAYKTSMRRACDLVQANRSMVYYLSCKRDPAALRIRLKDLAAVRVRYGYRRLHVLLRREGWQVNHKLVYRLYREEGLEVRTKKRKKRISALRVVLPAATAPNERWSMDFVADALYDGRRFRALTLVDNFTRESPAIEVGSSITGKRVVAVLDRLALTHGLPKVITTDNGTEFTSRALDEWAHQNGVKLDFIRPGKPVENAYIESFNGRLRQECLDENRFASLEDAKIKIEAWQRDYNEQRPHSSLKDETPHRFVENWRRSRPPEQAATLT
jgi:putative transposase